MSHEIYEHDSMFYAGETPWHGLGTSVERALTAEEAMIAAGLNWTVKSVPLYAMYDGGMIPVENRRGIIREDTREPLAVVGAVYHPFQNSEAFEFFDEAVRTKEAKYVTAGSLKNGRKVWILAEIGKSFKVADIGDEMKKYVLLYTSHDGTSAVDIMITPIRVVCWNTLNASLRQGERRSRLRHTPNIRSYAKNVSEMLGIVNEYYQDFEECANLFAKTPLKNEEEFERYLDKVGFKIKEDTSSNSRIIKIRDRLTELFDGQGYGTDMNKHSIWSAYNAVAEFVDHERSTRSTKNYNSSEDARLDSQWFGSGALIKRRAWDKALQMTK